MPNGYSGKVLRVDLSSGKVSVEKPDELFYRRYLGGWGFVAYYLLKELEPGIDPLGPANKLIFAPGIFTGVELSGSGRSAIGAKSPITGGFGEADAGGFFGAELARAGWDCLIVEGKASRPVYISIVNAKVEVRDASRLWGKDTVATEAALKQELAEPRTRFAAIGPAGEKQVLFASIMQDVHHAAGRAGLGAVMGSKNLKAVAVRGTLGKKVRRPATIRATAKWLLTNEGKARYAGLQRDGTIGDVLGLNKGGGLPTNNFQLGDFDKAEAIDGTTLTKTYLKERGTCFECAVTCKRVVEVKDGPFKVDPAYGGPEYETAAAFGSGCGVGDLAAVSKANEICNAAGLDTIAAGMLISFAMECFERGIITEKQTGGLKLNFGNADAMVKLTQMLADRQGMGDLLARGFEACIQKWGEAARPYALHVKKQPLPMHEPRFKFGLGVGYAMSPTGADHTHNVHDTAFATVVGLELVEGLGILEPMPPQSLDMRKVRLVYYHTLTRILKNSIGLCLFLPYYPNRIAELMQATTGWEISLFELMKAAERNMAMARAFNAREGFTTADDTLPERFFQPFPSGPLKGVAQDKREYAAALRAYCQMAGWDEKSGAPTRGKYADLDLDWLAQEMKARGKLVA